MNSEEQQKPSTPRVVSNIANVFMYAIGTCIILAIAGAVLTIFAVVILDSGYGGGKAKGTIVKINDGTADYGLIGAFYPKDGGEKTTGQFRLSKSNRFNSAKYEGKKVTIKECHYSDTDSFETWDIILYDYVSQ